MLTSAPDTKLRSAAALGRAVRRAREMKGLTQQDLARRVHASRPSLIALEAGRQTQALRLLFETLAELGLELTIRPRNR
jgi:DNA-binding XRE family transcriptional regulator